MLQVGFGRPPTPTMFAGNERKATADDVPQANNQPVRTTTTVEIECQTDPIQTADTAPPPYVNDARPPPSYAEVV